MKRFYPENTDSGMFECEDGDYVDFEDHQLAMMANDTVVRDLQRQLADAIRERDQYKAACEMADALRPLGAVQVVEGGGAVLLDTSKGAT